MAPEIPTRPYKTCGPHQDCQFEVRCEPRQRSWDEWAQPMTRRSRPFAPRTSRPTSKATAFAVFSWREMVDFHAPNCQAAAGREATPRRRIHAFGLEPQGLKPSLISRDLTRR